MSATRSKRVRAFREKFDRDTPQAIDDALGLVKELATAKFTESVDASVNLGVDPRKSDQVVRGSTVLPHGTGKQVRVAVFAQGAGAEAATEAGADLVGMDDLAEQVKKGELNFDVVIAAPDAMRVVGGLGKILGPRGLMPNPKVGTVTQDIGRAVEEQKAGKIEFRVDKNGIVHAPFGKLSFTAEQLAANLLSITEAIVRAKPASAKGVYMKKVSISSTMGPGIRLDPADLQAQLAG